MLIISCGAEKIITTKPVQAKDLYTGLVFKTVWNKAITLDTDVRILSAGYGLLKPNDMVVTYDRKINNKIATYLKDKVVVEDGSRAILSYLYSIVVPNARNLIPSGRLSLGFFLRAINALEEGPHNYIERDDGKLRELLVIGELRQQHRKRNGSCLALKNELLKRFMSKDEMIHFLETNFGPSLGASYMPTVTAQLCVLPKKYNLRLVKEDHRYHLTEKD